MRFPSWEKLRPQPGCLHSWEASVRMRCPYASGSTYIWLVACMCPHVYFKVCFLVKTPRAALNRTFVPFLVSSRVARLILHILTSELEAFYVGMHPVFGDRWCMTRVKGTTYHRYTLNFWRALLWWYGHELGLGLDGLHQRVDLGAEVDVSGPVRERCVDGLGLWRGEGGGSEGNAPLGL